MVALEMNIPPKGQNGRSQQTVKRVYKGPGSQSVLGRYLTTLEPVAGRGTLWREASQSLLGTSWVTESQVCSWDEKNEGELKWLWSESLKARVVTVCPPWGLRNLSSGLGRPGCQ